MSTPIFLPGSLGDGMIRKFVKCNMCLMSRALRGMTDFCKFKMPRAKTKKAGKCFDKQSSYTAIDIGLYFTFRYRWFLKTYFCNISVVVSTLSQILATAFPCPLNCQLHSGNPNNRLLHTQSGNGQNHVLIDFLFKFISQI